jgi:hypothetical protein
VLYGLVRPHLKFVGEFTLQSIFCFDCDPEFLKIDLENLETMHISLNQTASWIVTKIRKIGKFCWTLTSMEQLASNTFMFLQTTKGIHGFQSCNKTSGTPSVVSRVSSFDCSFNSCCNSQNAWSDYSSTTLDPARYYDYDAHLLNCGFWSSATVKLTPFLCNC